MSFTKVPCGFCDVSLRSPVFPPNTNSFQFGTEKTGIAVKFQRRGPQASPDAPSIAVHVSVSRSSSYDRKKGHTVTVAMNKTRREKSSDACAYSRRAIEHLWKVSYLEVIKLS